MKASTVRTRNFLRNRLLVRKQFIIDLGHPGRANVSKAELKAKVAEIYGVRDPQISVFGFRTDFGGGKSTCFGLMYNSLESAKKYRLKYRLLRNGLLASKVEKSRKQVKERKNRAKLRDNKKSKAAEEAKKKK